MLSQWYFFKHWLENTSVEVCVDDLAVGKTC